MVERGLCWDKVNEIYKQNVNIENEIAENYEGFYISNQVKNKHRIALLAVSSEKNDNKSKKFSFLTIYRPNTGFQTRQETVESILKKYKKVTPEEAKSSWIEQYDLSKDECTHVFRQGHCSNIRNCEVGLRTRKYHVLAGSVLTVWSKIENLLSSLTGYNQFRLQIIRVKTNDNQKIVGCVIPNTCVKQIETVLSSMSLKTSQLSYDAKNNDQSAKIKTNLNDDNHKYNNENVGLKIASNENNYFINNLSSSILNYDFT